MLRKLKMIMDFIGVEGGMKRILKRFLAMVTATVICLHSLENDWIGIHMFSMKNYF